LNYFYKTNAAETFIFLILQNKFDTKNHHYSSLTGLCDSNFCV